MEWNNKRRRARPAARGVLRNDALDNLILLLALWKAHPEQVQESDVRRLASGIEIVRLGPGNTLATYGELNALPVTSLTLSPSTPSSRPSSCRSWRKSGSRPTTS